MGNGVALIDPSVGQAINLGDYIISEAVRAVLIDDLGLEIDAVYPSTRRLTTSEARSLLTHSTVYFAGTNILSANMLVRQQWKFPLQYLRRQSLRLVGVGWWSYQRRPGAIGREVLRALLDPDAVHSVRDEYTRARLSAIGGLRVVNTSCPTLWRLPSKPSCRADRPGTVVFTLTSYRRDPSRDCALLRGLVERYERLVFWPQGDRDSDYLETLTQQHFRHPIEVVPRNVGAYDAVLRDEHVDYVGTRLHAGIRAMQYGRATFICAIDNRAIEIARDTGLSALPLPLNNLWHAIDNRTRAPLRLPKAGIRTWLEGQIDARG